MIENEWPRKERVVNRQQDEKQNSIERQVNLSIPRFSQQLDLTETLKVSFFFSFYEGQRKQKKTRSVNIILRHFSHLARGYL